MPTIRVADTESDGFLDEASRIWCIATLDYGQSKEDTVLFEPEQILLGLQHLHDCDVIVGHNWFGHDLKLLKKLHGWEPLPHQIVVDTLTFSRMMYPKRPIPVGCTTNKTHSIEAWGYRVGRGKPEHEDWSVYTPDMGNRCKEDTVINLLTLLELEKEADEVGTMFYHQAGGK